MRHILAVLAILLFPGVTLAATGLTPHSATYDMSYLKRSKDSAFHQVDGRMVYQYDLTCDAVIYNHRMVLDLVSKQGLSITSETVLSFYETLDGLTMRFQLRELLNDNLVVELEGQVSRPSVDQPGEITYDKREGPDSEILSILPPGALFPLQHTHAVIAKAGKGPVVHNGSTFDGDEVSLVSSLILPSGNDVREQAVVPEEMSGMKSWIARIAFHKPESEEIVPHYETEMRFYENGVSGDFTMESPELGIQARLTEVSLMEKPDCG